MEPKQITYIVVAFYKLRTAGEWVHEDEWSVYDNYKDARGAYNRLIEDEGVQSASITVPIESTDYDCIESWR
jgi:hypothetical protein